MEGQIACFKTRWCITNIKKHKTEKSRNGGFGRHFCISVLEKSNLRDVCIQAGYNYPVAQSNLADFGGYTNGFSSIFTYIFNY
tara:strand:- start:621 stop:869 length:249 start_codon:yes stop_codon:yes gene_type:complete